MTAPATIRAAYAAGQAFAILTAENPNGQQATPQDNGYWMQRLRGHLAASLRVRIPVRGEWGGNPERAFYCPGMDADTARALGSDYGQEAVITERGLIDCATGAVTPWTGVKEGPGPFGHSIDLDGVPFHFTTGDA